MELQGMGMYLAVELEELGYDCIVMPTTYGSTFTWDLSHPCPNNMGPFSSRHAAVAAGLGHFGMNNVVLTPQYGPLQRFVSVITTAEIKPDTPMADEVCPGESCGVCRKTCPSNCFGELQRYAFAGIQVRQWSMDKTRCGKPMCSRECIFTCPAGLKKRTPAQIEPVRRRSRIV